jgi:hypothetical protein
MIIFALKMLAAWFLLSVAFVAFVWRRMPWSELVSHRPAIKHPEENPKEL